MPTQSLARLRNVGVIAHIDAGKTTATERILFYTGRTHRLGSVDEGTTVTDWMEQERERGISIVAAAIQAQWRDCVINLIDTPGHIDFTAEVQRSLRVLDGALVVLDAVHGVQPQSETVWRQADRYAVPRLCLVNKMDRVGADFDEAAASITRRLGAKTACLQLPLGRETAFRGVVDLIEMKSLTWAGETGATLDTGEIAQDMRSAADRARAVLVERIAEADDELLALYVSGEAIDAGQLRAALRRATLAGRLVPVFCGSALHNIGIQPLLDGIVDYLPSPLDIGGVDARNPETGAALHLPPDDTGALAALVFKMVADPYAGHLAYVRVYSGALRSAMALHNATRNHNERAGRLLRMYANHREDVEIIRAGDIGAVLGLNHSFTGDTLCASDHPVLLEAIPFSEPVIRASVEPRKTADQERMAEALRRLAAEDPTFRVSIDENTGQMMIAGMGELHLEVMLERLHREQGVAASMGRPYVAYKETLTREVPAAEGRFIHQTGGRGQYGHVILRLRPAERGSGLRFENAIRGGMIPAQFIPAVEQGVREAAQTGVLAGFAVTDVVVTLQGGSSHPVDSSAPAYRAAAIQAFRDGLRLGEPVLVEPICRIEVLVPPEYTGAVLGQLAARRAEIESVEARAGALEAIVGKVPFAETFGYVTALRSATQGRGVYTMEFDHYAPMDAARTRTVLTGGLY
ncbi:MAG: translation elongation factor G [Betaproteobacteria bacterium RIFCSPLOWO2_12_FULL_66_14]|nr:MAG: translation elongation factor G [Betaproteobacteria bacterium RIFCSPLOWO2_12_FULL_66_14]